MSIGTMLALLTFLLYSVADAIVKSLGGRLDVVEISFFTTIFALVPTVLLKPREESWREVFRLLHPVLMNVRCLAAYAGGLCGTFAFLTIPLAEAYSLIFLTPVFVVLLSAPIFGERINWPRWVVLAMSFAGMLLVVRPGFRVFEIGHVAAICCALLGAINTMLVKQLAPRERRI